MVAVRSSLVLLARRARRVSTFAVLMAATAWALAGSPVWAEPSGRDTSSGGPRSPAGVHEVDGVVRDAQGRVLHRRLPPAVGEGGDEEFVYDPSASGRIPAELHRGDQVLEAPDGGPTPGEGEGVYAPEGLRRAGASGQRGAAGGGG